MSFVLKPPAYLAAVTLKCKHFQSSEAPSKIITNLLVGYYTIFILWNLRPSTIPCTFIPSLLKVLVFFRSDKNPLSQLKESNVLCKGQIGNKGLNMLFYMKLLSVDLKCVSRQRQSHYLVTRVQLIYASLQIGSIQVVKGHIA